MTTIPKRYVEYFSQQLQEGKIYDMRNFKVGQSKPSYRPVNHENMITFIQTIEVKEINAITVNISLYRFEFMNYNDIAVRYNDNTYLTCKYIYVIISFIFY